MGNLENRVAIVTGAARGLGEGVARRFAQEGAVVVCADQIDALQVAQSLPASPSGHRSSAVKLDLTDSKAVDALVEEVVGDLGRLDIMVNNAGVNQRVRDVVDTTDEELKRVFAVNLFAVFFGCRAAGRVMREQRSGRIINTASQMGKVGSAGWAIYCASKAAVILLTQAVAQEMAPFGVTVNCVCPGTMLTPGMRAGYEAAAAQSGEDAERLIEEKARSMPLARLGQPSDLGAMAAWIASDDACFTTGACFNLTGGETFF